MEVVYLGLISKIFNAVFDAILSPVFKFLASLLETVLSWLFDAVLEPLLVKVLWPLFMDLVDLIVDIFAGILFSVFADLMEIINAMQDAFNIFSGLQKVTYQGTPYNILELVFRMDKIQTAVWTVIAFSFVLMFLFAVLGTVRSMMDLEEGQRPVSKVLSSTFKAFFKMMLIPVVSLFAIVMACEILVAINTAFQGDQIYLSRMVFVVSSLDAAKDERYNISSTARDKVENIGTGDGLRKDFYEGRSSCTDKDTVSKTFKLGDFDYMIAFGGCAFLIVILATCLMTFISRIFEVILLFIVSPLFAAVMPLDDGEKFKAWQDMFVGKLFGGYGTVIAMQVYIILCPAVMDGRIVFGEGSVEANYLIRLIFLLGGAWATVKAGPTVTQLLNASAGMQEAETSRAVTAGIGATAAMAGSGAVSLAKSAKQKYTERKANRQAAMAESDKRIAKRLSAKPGGGGSPIGGAAAGFGGAASSGASAGSGASAALAGAGAGSGASTTLAGAAAGSGGGSGSGSATAGSGAPESKARRLGTLFGGRLTLNQTKGGHRYLGLNFGKKASFGRDKDGNFHARFLGIGVRVGKDGKVDKISLPFVRFKRGQREDGKSGNFHVSKVKVKGVVNFKRAESVSTGADGKPVRTMGGMYCSDISAIGLKRRYDSDTGKVEKLSALGAHYGKNASGEYMLTHFNSMLGRMEFDKGEDGKKRLDTVTTRGGHSLYQRDED